MSPNPLLEYVMIGEAVVCFSLLVVCWEKSLVRRFNLVVGLCGVWGSQISVAVAILFFRRKIGLDVTPAYNTYLYSFWIGNGLSEVLTVGLIFQIFRSAMSPFRGLRRLGTMMFRWVCGVSVAVTLGVTLAPMFGGASYLTALVQLGQSISILTICLLLFVCFAAHYLGMTYRSRTFGLSLGLGVQGLTSLMVSAWIATHGASTLYSTVNLFPALGAIVTMSIWGTYFLLPEPAQQMVLLPTTSPYFHWNQVSEALGDHPGMVAVAGFTPDMLSAAERKMLGASVSKRRSPAGSRALVNRVAASVDVPAQEHAVAMPR